MSLAVNKSYILMLSFDKLYFIESIGETILTPPSGIYLESYLLSFRVGSLYSGSTRYINLAFLPSKDGPVINVPRDG